MCDRPVHPRIRGEQVSQVCTQIEIPGSSPPPRGTAGHAPVAGLFDRFIPASAGNSHSATLPSARSPVHPRFRGEQPVPALDPRCVLGSSPPPRGTEPIGPMIADTGRFIPASAGNSGRRAWQWSSTPVHPRLRGEQSGPRPLASCHRGSSPPPRGTVVPLCLPLAQARFIPASAGNSRQWRARIRGAAVHPRLRGEQGRMGTILRTTSGSSPPPRGTDPIRGHLRVSSRFIPASAGNREFSEDRQAQILVHPRLRGEQDRPAEDIHLAFGSSPPPRGTACLQTACGLPLRFIPASAGNRGYCRQ